MAIGSNMRVAIGVMKSGQSPDSRRLSATLVSRPAAILELSGFVDSLAAAPGMLAPRFYLASLLSEPYKPCVVVVSEGKRVRGVVYCKERAVMGIPTGIVVADDTLDAMVAARPEEADSVIRCAIGVLLKHKTALRWRVSAERLPLLQGESASADADVHFRSGERHAYLRLPGTYDEFLGRVRRSTRHNLNRYRRRSEQAGNAFCPGLGFGEFCAAAEGLHPKSAYALSKAGLQRAVGMIAEMPDPLLVGLRQSGGEWVSLAGLWFAGGRALMALQLNDRSLQRESISLVLRACLIEHLIERGMQELVFLDGVSAPLSYYTEQREEFTAYIDSRSLGWRLVRRGCMTLGRVAPRTFANWQAWGSSGGIALTEG